MEVNVAHRLIHFMDSFNITVEEFSKISDFFNLNATHTIEEFWYDAKSFAESMLSEFTAICMLVYFSTLQVHFSTLQGYWAKKNNDDKLTKKQ